MPCINDNVTVNQTCTNYPHAVATYSLPPLSAACNPRVGSQETCEPECARWALQYWSFQAVFEFELRFTTHFGTHRCVHPGIERRVNFAAFGSLWARNTCAVAPSSAFRAVLRVVDGRVVPPPPAPRSGCTTYESEYELRVARWSKRDASARGSADRKLS